MAKGLKIIAENRVQQGSSHARRMRTGGTLPGIVYGAEVKPKMIQLNERDFTRAISGHGGEHMIMDLEIQGDGTKKVLLQEVQHHPLTGKIIHVDFHEISMTKKLRVEVPLKLVGEPVGVTQQGGVLEYLVREIEIECLPTDLLEHIDIDVAQLKIGDKLTVNDIKLDAAKYAIISSKDLAIVAVAAPREEEAAPTPEEAAAAAAAGPEVIREKKVEGEEGAAEGDGKDAAKGAAKDAKEKEPAKGGKDAKDAKK